MFNLAHLWFVAIHLYSTTDDEFDAVNVPFQVTAKAADDILKAWADNLVWLSMQQANMNLALDGVKNSCGEDQNVPAAALARCR